MLYDIMFLWRHDQNKILRKRLRIYSLFIIQSTKSNIIVFSWRKQAGVQCSPRQGSTSHIQVRRQRPNGKSKINVEICILILIHTLKGIYQMLNKVINEKNMYIHYILYRESIFTSTYSYIYICNALMALLLLLFNRPYIILYRKTAKMYVAFR